MTTRKYKFIEYIGGTFLAGRSVVAYELRDGTIQLRAETCGGKAMAPSRSMTRSEYEALKAEWNPESTQQDASVTARALAYFNR